MAYTVTLDAFHGPLDLLLYLVKKHEVDILDIPITMLTEQFRDYLRVMQTLDMDVAGDFIVMAGTLMVIKSQMILPQEPAKEEEDAPDPRRELVKQLLEYRKFKDAASALEDRAAKQAAHVPRQEIPEATSKAGPTVKPVELWDLVSAFARLMRETQAIETGTISVDDTPQHVHEEQIRRKVREEGRVAFRDLFTPPHHRARLIGLFLAVLELIKGHDITLEQSDAFGEIWLIAITTAPHSTQEVSDEPRPPGSGSS